MNCWHCGTELIWGGDHDTEDNEDYDIVSNLSCPNCHCHVEVYHPSEKLIKEYEDYEKKKVTPITYDEHNRDTSNDPFKGTNIEGKD